MALYSQASFKNSRVSTRKATSANDNNKISCPTGVNTLVSPANPNRTYVTIRIENTTSGDDLRYDYFDNASILTEGFLLKAGEAVDLEGFNPIYVRAIVNTILLSVDEGSG
jgi:hypothetical protein